MCYGGERGSLLIEIEEVPVKKEKKDREVKPYYNNEPYWAAAYVYTAMR